MATRCVACACVRACLSKGVCLCACVRKARSQSMVSERAVPLGPHCIPILQYRSQRRGFLVPDRIESCSNTNPLRPPPDPPPRGHVPTPPSPCHRSKPPCGRPWGAQDPGARGHGLCAVRCADVSQLRGHPQILRSVATCHHRAVREPPVVAHHRRRCGADLLVGALLKSTPPTNPSTHPRAHICTYTQHARTHMHRMPAHTRAHHWDAMVPCNAIGHCRRYERLSVHASSLFFVWCCGNASIQGSVRCPSTRGTRLEWAASAWPRCCPSCKVSLVAFLLGGGFLYHRQARWRRPPRHPTQAPFCPPLLPATGFRETCFCADNDHVQNICWLLLSVFVAFT